MLTVSPLVRELILACTHDPDDTTPERRRLRAVLLDQLRASAFIDAFHHVFGETPGAHRRP